LKSGRKAVVISVGALGAVVYDKNGKRNFPAFPVKVVDSTGAGDAFRAGLAVSLASGKDIDEAVRFANACGALATTVLGAEPSMPTLDQVERFLQEQKIT
ncbi:MAG: PfkB family carbohydrate kinase, partial [candidate division WOR-3 bacterium]